MVTPISTRQKMKKKHPTMPSTENAVLKPTYWKILWKRVSTKYWQTYGIRLCSPATMTIMAGAIVTGGAANLKNMEEAFSKRTKLEKVRMAKDSQLSLKGGIELKKDGMSNTIIALLAAGKETVIALNIRENRLSPFKPDSLPKKEKVQKKKEEDWHRKLKKNAERKKLKSNALPTAKAL